MLEDGRIAVFSVQNDSQGECEVALLTKTQKENVPEKTVITYGCVYPSSLLCAQVVRFNKLNTQFRIELKQYTEGSMDINAAKDALRMDILSGNAPDILDIGAGFSEEENFALIEAGALEDLTSLYSEHYGDKKLVQGFNRGKMLEALCQLNMDRFVDQETGECHFEEESFLQILELAGRFGGEENKQVLSRLEMVKFSLWKRRFYLFQIFNIMNISLGIPVKKSVIDMLCEEQMEIEYEEDEEGNLQERSKTSWKIDDMVVKYYAVTKKEADYFKGLLEQIGNSMDTGVSQGLITIIQEEAAAYFEGVKPVEEAARVIQNRAQNYINETFHIPDK